MKSYDGSEKLPQEIKVESCAKLKILLQKYTSIIHKYIILFHFDADSVLNNFTTF